MKRTAIALIILVILLLTIVIGFGFTDKYKKKSSSDKIQIVTTVFPLYDFIKNVGRDKVEVSMIIPSGVDVHDYEPTPQDIIKINDADLFIYMGDDIEYWAKTISDGVDDKSKIVDISNGINYIETEEFEHKHGIEADKEEEHNHHSEKYDAHIWLDPSIAIQMVNNIEEIISEFDSQNSSYYRENRDEYNNQIEVLDSEIADVVSNAKTRKVAFGGPFAYAYFIEKYNLDFISAYDSCGENGEPSVFKLKEVVDYIEKNGLKVIFYKELSSGSIAKTISEETGAEMLEFNSLHTVTDKELENNVSYISVMRRNLDNLKKALN